MPTEQRIVIESTLYLDLDNASGILRLSRDVVEHRCRSRLDKWQDWKFINTTKKVNGILPTAVWYKGRRFKDVREAAVKSKTSVMVIQMYIHSATCPESCYELPDAIENHVNPTIVQTPDPIQVASPQLSPKRKRERPVNIEGVHYDSLTAAANALRMNISAILKRIQSKEYAWLKWKFEEDDGVRRCRYIRVLCNDKEYLTVTAAAKVVGISPITMRKRIEDPKFPHFSYIAHGLKTKNYVEAFQHLQTIGLI